MQPRLRFVPTIGWFVEVPYVFSDIELCKVAQFCAKKHYAKIRTTTDKGDMKEWVDKLRTFVIDGQDVVWDCIHPLPLKAVPKYLQQRVVGERGDSLGDMVLFKGKYESNKSIIDLGA